MTSADQVVLAGGGGTAAPVAEALRGLNPPSIVVVLTDGMNPWPVAPTPQARIIAGLIGPDITEPPSWITVVNIPMRG